MASLPKIWQFKHYYWWETFFGGHLNLGKRITIFGSNAMCWAVNIQTKKWGYVCFSLPSKARYKSLKENYYFYLSPNATPWAATYYKGPNKLQKELSKIRRQVFGHNFNSEKANVYEQLRRINEQNNIRIILSEL